MGFGVMAMTELVERIAALAQEPPPGPAALRNPHGSRPMTTRPDRQAPACQPARRHVRHRTAAQPPRRPQRRDAGHVQRPGRAGQRHHAGRLPRPGDEPLHRRQPDDARPGPQLSAPPPPSYPACVPAAAASTSTAARSRSSTSSSSSPCCRTSAPTPWATPSSWRCSRSPPTSTSC